MRKLYAFTSLPISTLISSLHSSLSTSLKSFSVRKDITCSIPTNISAKRLNRRLEGKTRSALEGRGRSGHTVGGRNKFFWQPRHKYIFPWNQKFIIVFLKFLRRKIFWFRWILSLSPKTLLPEDRPPTRTSSPEFPAYIHVPSRCTFLSLFVRICTDIMPLHAHPHYLLSLNIRSILY